MTMIDTGTYGAKVQSWRKANPRQLLRETIEAHPKMSKERCFAKFLDALNNHDDADALKEGIIEYWFSNNYHSLIETPPAVMEQRERQKQSLTGKIKAQVKERIQEEAALMLLDLTLPNGKALRDCTGGECAALGKKMGSWLGKLAKAVKADQLVGEVLTEDQVRAYYKSK